MAFDLNSINKYVNEMSDKLIGKVVTSPKTIKYLTLQTGVKGDTAINLLTNSIFFQDGTACGFSNSGTSTFSQRKITPGVIKAQKSYCDKSLTQYWAGYDVKVAAGAKTLPFEEDLINTEIAYVGSYLEKAIWQGDTNSSDVNLNKFDGLIKIIDAASGSTQNAANGGATGITSTNIIGLIQNVFSAIPAELIDKDDVAIYCGYDVFRTYILALTNANMFNYTGTVDSTMEIVIPGTSVKLIAVPGLNSTNRMFAFQTANVFYGTDLLNDEEKFDFWYSQDNREFRLEISFSAGVQIAFPDQVVRFKLA